MIQNISVDTIINELSDKEILYLSKKLNIVWGGWNSVEHINQSRYMYEKYKGGAIHNDLKKLSQKLTIGNMLELIEESTTLYDVNRLPNKDDKNKWEWSVGIGLDLNEKVIWQRNSEFCIALWESLVIIIKNIVSSETNKEKLENITMGSHLRINMKSIEANYNRGKIIGGKYNWAKNHTRYVFTPKHINTKNGNISLRATHHKFHISELIIT